jgi:TolB-like protein
VSNVTALAHTRETIARTQPEAIWRFYLAGAMRLIAPDGAESSPLPRKARALLAYLCLSASGRVSRPQLTALLWDKTDDLARRSLRQALYDIERLTGAKTAGLIEFDDEYIRLNKRLCWIDVLAEPDHHIERLLDDLDDIATKWDQWLSGERSRREDHARHHLESELARLREEKGPADRRAASARKLLNFDPINQEGAFALMTALAEMGNHVQALREYQRYRKALWDAFEIMPARELAALYEAIRVASPRNTVRITKPQQRDLISVNANSAAADPERPTIAVMPFQNISGERRHNYTAQGLAEDLISVLSRVPGFFVISRWSTLTVRDHSRTPQDVSDLLNVRYLLSGSVRVDGSRLYVTAELADAPRGVVLWSAGIERQFSSLIDVPLQLAEEIVREAAPHLRAAELSRVRAKPPEHLSSYEYFLQAQEDMHNFSPAVFLRAERMFEAALEQTPNYAAALAWRAYWHVLRIGQGWSPDPGRDAQLAAGFADRALECDGREPMALGVQGHIAAYLHKNFALAAERFENALELNPNAASVWLWSAAARAWAGDGKAAVIEVNKGTALSPYDPLMYFSNTIAGMAYLADAQYERAVESAYLALRDHRRYTAAHRLLVIGLMLVGRADEGRAAANRLSILEPGVTVERFRARYPGAGAPQADLYCEALAQAGVPRR